MPINNNILNQKGTPAFYSDIFANRPAFGYAGRVFISTDTGAIYEDTGTAWTLIADAGAGTTGTLQQVTTNGNTTTLGISVQGLTIGKGAGTIASNTAIGFTALNGNTTGSSNTGIGYQSLAANTTGNQNTAIGGVSLTTNTTGFSNTAIGYTSLFFNTTGGGNIAIGSASLLNNTTGNDNIAIGFFAGGGTTGNTNTIIGKSAGAFMTTASSNVLIGNLSGYNITTGSNNTILGSYQGTTTLASNIILSDGAGNVRLYSNSGGLIGIGQAVGTPGGQLDIHTAQTYALVLNGLTTNNAYTAFSNNSVGKWRIGNTYNAGANSFDIYNLGTSSNALSFNSTTNAATFSSSVTATSANGSPATSGTTQTASLRLAYSNGVGLDFGAYSASPYGTWLQAADRGALGSTYPLILNPNGGNVGIGTSSPAQKLSIVTSGGSPSIYLADGTTDCYLAIATSANGYANGTSAGDIVLRGTSGISFSSNGGSSTAMRITSGGNVLVGTTTDDTVNKLQVTGSAIFSSTLRANSEIQTYNGANNGYWGVDAGNSYVYFGTSSSGYALSFQTAGTQRLGIASTGAATLSNLAGTGSRAVLADANGLLSAPVSDISVKENISNIGYGLSDVLKMNPVWFNYNDEYKNYGEGRQNGNIAQEMQAIIPEAVFTTPSTGKMGINYDQLHAVYIKAIQELKAEIDALKNN
jgi:hypothetical protein